MVCAVDRLAAEAGLTLLQAGGTAADAAVGASAVLAVTAQHMCGMGGDLFALVHAPGTDRPALLNASGRAGSGADPQRLRDEGRTRMPGTGDIRSVPVPACVDGWLALHARHGRLPLAAVLEPALRHATDGFPASRHLSAAVTGVAHLPAAADYTARGRLEPGAVVRRPGAARTLAALAEGGRASFYEGEFGRGLLGLGRGEYELADLARPHADWGEPLGLDVWGRRVWTARPNSQGYLVLAAAWMAEGLPLPRDPADPLWPHLLVEASRQAGFDRLAVLHEHADGDALVAPARLTPRRAAIRAEQAALVSGPQPTGLGTVALAAVDGEGMGVSLIQSNGAGFGSLLAEPATGIFLHNRGIGFSLEPGHPAEYGPGRRPPHTLVPLLVTDLDGSLAAVAGTMGGDSQPQILLQLLARLLVSRQSTVAAVAAPRWVLVPIGTGTGFDTWERGGAVRVAVEEHAPTTWHRGLAARGHLVVAGGTFGHAQLITVGASGLEGTADPRSGTGAAIGW